MSDWIERERERGNGGRFFRLEVKEKDGQRSLDGSVRCGPVGT